MKERKSNYKINQNGKLVIYCKKRINYFLSIYFIKILIANFFWKRKKIQVKIFLYFA